jgi:hypothetical protein
MACLGGRAELTVLQAATGVPAAVVEERLAPALEEGVLVAETGVRDAVQFRHDRMREAVLAGLGTGRDALHLTMARRLARERELYAVAAEQYLPVIDLVTDPTERREVVRLLRRAADPAVLIGNHELVHQLLTAALALADPCDATTLVALHTGRHRALFGMGRLEEADEAFRSIDGLSPTAPERGLATAVQVRSLTHRKRFASWGSPCRRPPSSQPSSTASSTTSTGGWTPRPTTWPIRPSPT